MEPHVLKEIAKECVTRLLGGSSLQWVLAQTVRSILTEGGPLGVAAGDELERLVKMHGTAVGEAIARGKNP